MKFEKIILSEIKKPKRPVFRVFIHCSASDKREDDNALVIDQWHRARGFNGIGYHFFIRKDGTIQEGRDLEKVPAAQEGHNRDTIAICCHGLKKENFTEEQKASLLALCVTINRLYAGGLTFHGHCEVSAKTCPVYPYQDWLGLDHSGRMKLT